MKNFVLGLFIISAIFSAACSTTNKKSTSEAPKQGAGVKIDSTLDHQVSGQVPGQNPGAGAGSGSGGTTSPANPTNPGTGTTTGSGSGALPNGATDCYKADPSICKIEAEILRLTNEERAHPTKPFQSPHPALKAASKLSFVARDWSGKQAARGSIGHDGFPNRRMSVFHQEFPSAEGDISGENVAMTGYDDGDVAQQFFTMWLNSPGHYANMMGDYAAMGIGVSKSDGGWYATECFGEEN